MVNPGIEEIKILLIEEASSQKSILQSSGRWDEAVQMDLHFYQWNTEEMSAEITRLHTNVDDSPLCP